MVQQRWSNRDPVHADALTTADRQVMRHELATQGFTITPRPLLDMSTIQALHDGYEQLFQGNFDTGVYPDEIHWRKGLSRPTVTREICNAYKANRLVASVVLNAKLAALAAEVQGWSTVRMGQDDVIWKPPQVKAKEDQPAQRPETTVGYHKDSEYISKQFTPYENSSVTIWIALDDADEETGCVEYVAGSHSWEHDSSDEKDEKLTFFPQAHNHQGKDDTLSLHRQSLPRTMDPNAIFHAKCPAGHAIFHHQDVWHGSGPNQSTTRHRRALVAHLLNGNVQWKPIPKNTGSTHLPPWTGASYIYGRYRRSGQAHLDEDFFPILYATSESGVSATPWVATYLSSSSSS